ncbi:MAG TPA: GyrI-like domain-containing protein [Gemmatimonadales bacterium]|nr:GyrI-like domain-containing protein [Gemmatimonadales bacterium]
MATASKLDLYKLHAAEYVKPKRPVLLATKPARYLAIDGAGDPNGPAFGAAVGPLYAMAWTIKMGKKRLGQDFKVPGLEGLWWCAGGKPDRWMVEQSKSTWRWKLLIRMPDTVNERCLEMAAELLEEKGRGTGVRAVKLERIAEGKCVQMLHVGPYMAEKPTIDAMLAFAKEQGLRFTGRHHEIYLSDPRRVTPEKLKTILRHPVK